MFGFDWTQLSFILGNLLGTLIKSRPNVGIWKDKYIPGAIFALMLATQFVKAIATGVGLESSATESSVLLAGWFNWSIIWEAVKQAGVAILINQCKKQAGKPE